MITAAQRPHVGGDGRPSAGWHTAFGDATNDGLDDLFVSKGNVDQMMNSAMDDPKSLLEQQADGRFVEVSAESGVASFVRSRGAALVDLNGDGFLDLAVNNRRAPLDIYQNVTKAPRNWLSVSLRQEGSKPSPSAPCKSLRLTASTPVNGQSAAGRPVGAFAWSISGLGPPRRSDCA